MYIKVKNRVTLLHDSDNKSNSTLGKAPLGSRYRVPRKKQMRGVLNKTKKRTPPNRALSGFSVGAGRQRPVSASDGRCACAGCAKRAHFQDCQTRGGRGRSRKRGTVRAQGYPSKPQGFPSRPDAVFLPTRARNRNFSA